jgi:resuscitation-promoting factor RpfB
MHLRKATAAGLSLFFLLSPQLLAQTPAQAPSSASSAPQASSVPHNATPKPKCTDTGTYVNSQGKTVKRPENCTAAPQGATALCRDGSYSFSQSRRGTCSHHGGVAKWFVT